MRKLFVVLSVVLAIAVSGAVFLDYFFTDLVTKKGGAQVVGLPDDYGNESYPPYTGPHPSTIDRSHDPFAYPIKIGEVGPIEPLFAGPLQYPFLCRTEKSGLGQPMVDNQMGIGVPIFEVADDGSKTEKIVGYSKDCLIPTRAYYYYNREGTKYFFPIEKANNDIAKTTVNGKEVDFIVRIEIGVINRYLYGIAVIKGDDETIELPTGDNWNQRLVYQFRGGVGIGKKQGRLRPSRLLERRFDELKKGYAIAYSSGNQTSNHYNLWQAEELVMRVKNQFVALYGDPLYTVGVGGSGGAIQQFIIAQNHPGLIDGALALYSYPDMLSQITYAYDCDLLEYHFDVGDDGNKKWDTWENRIPVEGLNARTGADNKFSTYYTLARVVNGVWPPWTNGMSECVNGWRGLIQLTNNPWFVHFFDRFEEAVVDKVHWTHWDDLKHIYGKSPNAYANSIWDNVGVQYGLGALAANDITIDEFLKLNAHVGGWKKHDEYQQENYWKVIKGVSLSEFSPWSHHNMSHGTLEEPAQRTEANIDAIRAAYMSGHVFLGKIDIPVIDLRHYLEDELDMHHISASFSTRERMERAMGHHENQVIWVTKKPHMPLGEAFDALDKWILAQQKHPENDVVASKPQGIEDQCWETENTIHKGETVWDGEWNQQPSGKCVELYPVYKNSRWVAGDSVAGETFKCQLQSVAGAIEKGIYQGVDMSSHQETLERIFPDGVCDYSKPSIGMPDLESLGMGQDTLVAERDELLEAEEESVEL